MSCFFDIVRNDKEIIDIYNRINEYEIKEGGRAHHDFNHVINVSKTVKQILKELNYKKDFIDEAQVAAILHDIGCLNGKEGHEIRSFEYSKEYLKRKNIKLKNEEMILEAIKNHRNGFDTDNIITLALIFSDKLDIKKTRITPEGCKIIGNRQFKYINDINLKIDDESLNVYFMCDNQLDLKELEEYYFTAKVFNAIESFSNRMKLKPNVFINNEKWTSFYKKDKTERR